MVQARKRARRPRRRRHVRKRHIVPKLVSKFSSLLQCLRCSGIGHKRPGEIRDADRLELVGFPEKDVGGFQVPVGDSVGVDVGQGAEEDGDDVESDVFVEAAAVVGDVAGEVAAVA